jgi:spermidine synthase
MGAVFPLALAVSSNQSGSAEVVGRLYAINTAGAILGACLAGLLVIPWLGLHGAFLLSASLDLAMAAALLGVAPGHWRGRLILGAIPIAAGGMMLYTAPPWDPSTMATGVNYLAPTIYANGPEYLSALLRETQILQYREGATGTVAVAERGALRLLSIDGYPEASNAAATQILLPHYAMATGAARRRALVIGYGSGNTAGSLTLYPFEQIDVAEIESATIEAGPFFEAINHRPDRDARVHIHTADGRSWLAAASRDNYDVILSDPSMPWTPGSAKLFTRDFFRLAHTRLRSGGVFAQSIPLYNLDFRGVQSLVRTFNDAFPQMLAVTCGRRTGELILLGSDRPVKLDWSSLNQLFVTPDRAADLIRGLLPDPGSVAGRILFGTAEIPAFTAGAPLNTDNNGRIEFASLANLYRDMRGENVDRLFESAVDARNYLVGAPADARNRILLQLAAASVNQRDFRRGLWYAQELLHNDDSYASNLVTGDVLYGLLRRPEAIEKWRRSLKLQPGGTAALLRLVRHYRPMWPRDRPKEFDAWAAKLAKSYGAEIPVPPALLTNPVEP